MHGCVTRDKANAVTEPRRLLGDLSVRLVAAGPLLLPLIGPPVELVELRQQVLCGQLSI
jgi:hypothetical protein